MLMALDPTSTDWMLFIFAAICIGMTKAGISGLSVMVGPIMADIFPAKASVGLVLGLLITADLGAIVYYRKHPNWKAISKLLPWSIAGVAIGYFCMDMVNDKQLKPIIGFVVLSLLIVNYYVNRIKKIKSAKGEDFDREFEEKFHAHPTVAAIFGLTAGITTMMANAAGPVMMLYLLASGFPKNKFIATNAFIFFVLNWIKVPFHLKLGTVTMESFTMDLFAIPAVIAGLIIGVLIVKKISQKVFYNLAQAMAAISSIKLLIGNWL